MSQRMDRQSPGMYRNSQGQLVKSRDGVMRGNSSMPSGKNQWAPALAELAGGLVGGGKGGGIYAGGSATFDETGGKAPPPTGPNFDNARELERQFEQNGGMGQRIDRMFRGQDNRGRPQGDGRDRNLMGHISPEDAKKYGGASGIGKMIAGAYGNSQPTPQTGGGLKAPPQMSEPLTGEAALMQRQTLHPAGPGFNHDNQDFNRQQFDKNQMAQYGADKARYHQIEEEMRQGSPYGGWATEQLAEPSEKWAAGAAQLAAQGGQVRPNIMQTGPAPQNQGSPGMRPPSQGSPGRRPQRSQPLRRPGEQAYDEELRKMQAQLDAVQNQKLR